MKRIKLVLIFCTLITCISVSAQKAMMRPKIFDKLSMSYSWSKVASDRNWGELSHTVWKVYADRDGVEVYDGASTSHKKGISLNFLDPVFISEISGDFAHVYKNISTKDGESLSGEIGWVELDKLLLWDQCPMTSKLIYRKAIILTNLSSTQAKRGEANITEEVHLYNSPSSKHPNKWEINELEFYFVYKTIRTSDNRDYALLMKTEKIQNSGQDSKGWTDKYTLWETRLCFEPNWEISAPLYAVVFDEQYPEEAYNYMRDGKFDPEDTLNYHFVWYDSMPDERWDLLKTRLPKLDDKTNNAKKYNIEKVGTIAQVDKKQVNSEAQVLRKDIEERIKKLNIVFVMDGTNSMTAYYPDMCRAIQTAMPHISAKNIGAEQVQFGAVIYQNEADGAPKVEKLGSADNVIGFLKKHKCTSTSSDPYEAMFDGLYFATTKIDWNKQESNFIILVGDAASKKPNRRGLNEEKIGKQMASLNINFVAFQANNFDGPNSNAYKQFLTQIDDIMLYIAQERYGRTMTSADFPYGDNKKEFKAKKEEDKYFPMKLSFINANIGEKGKAEFLRKQIVQNIDSFISIQQRTLEGWKEINKVLRTGGTLNLEILKRQRDMTDELIAKIQAEGRSFNTDGYTTNYVKGKEVLVTSIYLTKSEYDKLVDGLNRVAVYAEDALTLQEALVTLGKSYLGEIDVNNMDINDLMSKVLNLGDIDVFQLPPGITLKDLTDPSMEPETIKRIIKQTKDEVRRFEDNSENWHFEQNGLDYYYVPLWEMPFQEH